MAKTAYRIINPAAPVNVYSSKEGGLSPEKMFANQAEFEDWFTRRQHQPLRCSSNQDRTDICIQLVGREEAAEVAHEISPEPAKPRQPRAERDYSSTGAGKPVRLDSSLGKILGLMIEGKWSMAQIIEKSGVEGGVVSAEDKVLHRIRVILHGKNGIGHVVENNIIKARLPEGFDKKTIFSKK